MSSETPSRINALGQPIGVPVANWIGSKTPTGEPLEGRFCRVERLNVERHGDELIEAYTLDVDGSIWTYLGVGPFETKAALKNWIVTIGKLEDPLAYVIVDSASRKAVGLACYMRIAPDAGSIEVGSIVYSPQLQRTPLATEAMFLMMAHAFEGLGYRRYEWKCDNLNAPSRRAAARYGFSYEGVFRQALVYKGRNRDTAWFSILDSEWPGIKSAFIAWLDPENFDNDGLQKQKLAELIAQKRGFD